MKISITLALLLFLSFSCTSADTVKQKVEATLLKGFDSNKDGVLNKDERTKILKKFDANKNGKLDKPERLALVKIYRKKPSVKASMAPEDGEKQIYKKVDALELPLYIYTPVNHTEKAKTPAVVFLFGGGWKIGLKQIGFA